MTTNVVPAGTLTVGDLVLPMVVHNMHLKAKLEGRGWIAATTVAGLRERVVAALEEAEHELQRAKARANPEYVAVGDGTVLVNYEGRVYEFRGAHATILDRALVTDEQGRKTGKEVYGLRRVTPEQAAGYKDAVREEKDASRAVVEHTRRAVIPVVRPVVEQADDGRIAIFYGDRSLPVMLELGMDGEQFLLDGERGHDIAALCREVSVKHHPQRGRQVMVIDGDEKVRVVDAAMFSVIASPSQMAHAVDFDADELLRAKAAAKAAQRRRALLWDGFSQARLPRM